MRLPLSSVMTASLEVRLAAIWTPGTTPTPEADAIRRELYARQHGEAAAVRAWGPACSLCGSTQDVAMILACASLVSGIECDDSPECAHDEVPMCHRCQWSECDQCGESTVTVRAQAQEPFSSVPDAQARGIALRYVCDDCRAGFGTCDDCGASGGRAAAGEDAP